ncbi:MAG: hypothetical protein FIA97_06400 [Methylococcaceae bacterium]|nr:hypothetical protein [Methylococcaceae bacterium]
MHRILLSLFALIGMLPFAAADDAAALPEVACRYEMRVLGTAHGRVNASRSWYFWRTGSTVQTRDDDGDHGEIWERTDKNVIAYRKLYHQDRTAVEYAPADRAIHGLDFDWQRLASMLAPKDLEALKVSQRKTINGEPAELRKGVIGGQELEVTWLTQTRLPASIKKTVQGEIHLLELQELRPIELAPWHPTPIETIDAYRQIDATDLGDMENDPFVKKVLHENGHHH